MYSLKDSFQLICDFLSKALGKGSFFILLLLSALPLAAQQDSTKVYQNTEGFGGPKTVGAQLQADNQPRFQYRIPIKHTKGWYDLKAKASKEIGLEYGINYTSIFIYSTQTISDSNRSTALGGILDIQAGWNFLNRKKGKNTGKLFLKINSRHSYRGPNSTPPMFHGIAESGYFGLPATGYRHYSIRITELNYQQSLWNNRFHFVVGKVDATNYFNFHGLIVPWQHFIGYGASVSATGNWPDNGLGAIISIRPTKKLYLMAGLTDVRGDVFRQGEFFNLGDQFQEGKFWKAVEVGYVPVFEERYFRKISLTYWHSDSYTNVDGADIPFGQGITFSAHWFFQDRFIPYIRFGFSNGVGENNFARKDLQIGHGLRFKNYDILGVALSVNEPSIPDVKNQFTAEVFYRINLTAHLELTPSMQFIANPSLNPRASSLLYFGFRGRITL